MATTTVKTETFVGKRIRRREDPRLITGTATYVEDIQMPGMHYAMILRSPHAAARIRSINTKPAEAAPGVVCVFTGKDTKGVGVVPCGVAMPDLRVPQHTILATDRVYFVGHPVAVVVARDRYLARDAADLIEVDYEVLPAVADPEKALAKGAPAVHPQWPDNIAFTYHQDGGNIDKAFAEADVVVKQRDGTILGIKLKLIQDVGAYHQLLTPLIPQLSVLMMPGIYNTQNIRADIVGVFTNCVPTDAYRGAGRPEATHGIERMVDVLAAELKMDPAEIRFKNFVTKDKFPYATATGLMYDSGDYAAPLRKALDLVGYVKLRLEQADLRKQRKYMGIGISTYGEICAIGPSPATPAGGWESATVKIDPTGKVTILTGTCPHGQGEETTFAQIAADELGVGLDDILVIRGDTAVVQYGIGTFGSRATAVGGTAVYYALQDLKEIGRAHV